MALTTTVPVTPATAKPVTGAGRGGALRRSPTATVLLLLGAAYCLFPVLWVLIASTKSASELFSTLTLSPSTHLFDNVRILSDYRGGLYWRWMLNSALYAGVGAAASTLATVVGSSSGMKLVPGGEVIRKAAPTSVHDAWT